MRTKRLTVILTCLFCFLSNSTIYACPDPLVAILNAVPAVVPFGGSVVWDGSASYAVQSNIVKCEWDFEYDGTTFVADYTETPGDKKAEYTYSTRGIHTAALRVTNTESATDIDTCMVLVYADVHNLNQDEWYVYIQSAIDEANEGDIIEVSPGIYNECVDFNGLSCVVRSVDPNSWDIVERTVINASCDSNDSNTYGCAVTFANGEDANSVLSGFTITGAYNNLEGGGIYCSYSSPTISKCVITDNYANKGAGLYNVHSAPAITNCTFVGNEALTDGGGIYNSYAENTVIENCLLYSNKANNGSGIYNANSSSLTITNCTVSKNTASNAGSMYNSSASPTVINSVFWDNTGGEIVNSSSSPVVTYCNIEGSPVYTGMGNINSDPCFVDIDANEFYVNLISPCVDAGEPNDEFAAGYSILLAGVFDKIPVDVGYHYYAGDSNLPYATSFEECQDYEASESIDSNSDWVIDEGDAVITEAIFYADDVNEYSYQYVLMDEDSTISRDLGNCKKGNSRIRINCIPSEDLYVNLSHDGDIVASIHFEDSNTISVLDDGNYVDTATEYFDIADKCRVFLANENYQLQGYSYENTWVGIEFRFDWENQTYDVFWTNCDNTQGSYIKTNAAFDETYRSYTDIKFETGSDDSDKFCLNRLSITDEQGSGGVFGSDNDAWIILPEADIENPLIGRYDIIGTAWYDQLCEYKIKCCQIDLGKDDPNNWILIDAGTNPRREAIIGSWDTSSLSNGDYYLKIEIYDDLGRLHCSGLITKEITYNTASGSQTLTVDVQYPVVGRAKPKTLVFQEHTDIKINWPGSFPFEFSRTYNHSMRKQLFPLFFGWTHNHNIKIMENCEFDWEVDPNGQAISDEEGIGIGRLWLLAPTGGVLFRGNVDANVPDEVVYWPVDESRADYVVRTTVYHSGANPTFDVEYTHYAPDGMELKFQKSGNKLESNLSQNEGAIRWCVYTGVDRQEDRFGNALIYSWYTDDIDGDGVDDDVCIEEIANNRTDAKLVFENDLELYSGSPKVYSRIFLVEGDVPVEDDMWVMRFSCGGLRQQAIRNSPGIIGNSNVIYDYNINFELEKRWTADDFGVPYPITINSEKYFYFYPDGSLRKIFKWDDGDVWPSAHGTWYCFCENYSYDYDQLNNLITTTDFLIQQVWTPYAADDDFLYRTKRVCSNSCGAVLKDDTIAYSNPDFEPYDYNDTSFFDSGRWAGGSVGGGATKGIEYLYEDQRYELKPTTILEYDDSDGNGVYDSNNTCHITKLFYDDRGNTVEQRNYIDPNRFVLNEYEYHPEYNFTIRQTTWQGYCYSDGNDVIKVGPKVEKLYKYGNMAGDVASGDPNVEDIYLVEERKLLEETESPQQQTWAITSFVYNTMGNPVSRTDPCGSIDFYEYDASGLINKEWNGSQLDVYNQPIGNPQKRYYFDGLGNCELKGDYLGKVERYFYDELNRVIKTNTYQDQGAMNIANDFVSSSYLDDTEPPYEVYYVSQTKVEFYNPYDKEVITTLPYGGRIKNFWCRDKYIKELGPEDKGMKSFTEDGQIYYMTCEPIVDSIDSKLNIDSASTPFLAITHFYDSANRLKHKTYLEYIYGYPRSYSYYTKHEVYDYDGFGNKMSEKIFDPDPNLSENGNYIEGYYSSVDKYIAYEYDLLNRVTKQTVAPNEPDDPNFFEDYPDYEPLNIVTQYGYDAAGNQIYTITPHGDVIFVDYDNANRKVCEYFVVSPVYYSGTNVVDIDSTKANAKPKTAYEYHLNDDIKSVTNYDNDGATPLAYTGIEYDLRNRIQTVTEDINDSESAITNYYYDDAGFELFGDEYKYQVRIADAESQNTYISLDFHSKPQKILYPSGDYEQMVYDGNGLLIQKLVFDEADDPCYINYEYNDYGKLTKKIYPDGGWLDYEYTKIYFGKFGKVKTITDHRNADDRPGEDGRVSEIRYSLYSNNINSYADGNDFRVRYKYSTAYDKKTKVEVVDCNEDVIYSVGYDYDMAGRLVDVNDYNVQNINIASFTYDDLSRRKQMKYWLDGDIDGPNTTMKYGYDLQNNIIALHGSAFVVPLFISSSYYSPQNIDGLGRLKYSSDLVARPALPYKTHNCNYDYDMRSQLLDTSITNVGGATWTADLGYNKDGNIDLKTVNGQDTVFGYDGDLLTDVGNDELDWDKNGRLAVTPTINFEYNWEGKLRSATIDGNSIAIKYDPMGNRIVKNSTINGDKRYVVDIAGSLPTILCEIDLDDPCDPNGSLEKSYIYTPSSQILAQYDCNGIEDGNVVIDANYFYIADRLGSVRVVINNSADVNNTYTYSPFGQMLASECTETVYNPFKFTGQWYDEEIGQYYLRARQYDPALMRFVSRDPVRGKRKNPLSFNPYLYCQNNSINSIDPSGRLGGTLTEIITEGAKQHAAAISTVAYGVSIQSDKFINLGLAMDMLVGYKMGMAPIDSVIGGMKSGVLGYISGVLKEGYEALNMFSSYYDVASGKYITAAAGELSSFFGISDNEFSEFEDWVTNW